MLRSLWTAASGMAVMAFIYGPGVGFLLCDHEARKAQDSGATSM